ncbi:hypothetical protein BT96DRAFT_986837 [Gymnopus androsaceus JB14]|uniref:Uncharacterized protein n=1 Tax=Gymnopus androsaceus JB14 TaxID=1447944 RepID=A0A6A4IB41_9AGAR|nr:hypothetical protein BT96DRAFT_986837 [Gymnopus androsaceus JB14]
MTSREGKKQAKEEAVKKAAKKKAKDDRQKRNKDLELEDILCHAAQEKESAAFSGSIKSKSKHKLQDILFALGLEANGTVAVLWVCVNAHFDATPLLKEDLWYAGLFKTTHKWKHRVDDNNENDQPSSSHCRSTSPDFQLPSSPILPHPLPHARPCPCPQPIPHQRSVSP